VKPEEDAILVDIEGTLAESRLDPILLERPGDLPPFPGAAEALGGAAGRYRIIYLSARPARVSDGIRGWLGAHRFPAGPILFRDLWSEWRVFEFKEEEFKREACADLKGRLRVRWAIGNAASDGEAFASSGFPSLIIGLDRAKVDPDRRSRIQTPRDWDEVRKTIGP